MQASPRQETPPHPASPPSPPQEAWGRRRSIENVVCTIPVRVEKCGLGKGQGHGAQPELPRATSGDYSYCPMTEALFVLSTGRCGTQWLASVLEEICGDSIEIMPEPLGDHYAARRMLAADDPGKLAPDLAEPILAHLDTVAQTLATRSYNGRGDPSWNTMPHLLVRRLRLRLAASAACADKERRLVWQHSSLRPPAPSAEAWERRHSIRWRSFAAASGHCR